MLITRNLSRRRLRVKRLSMKYCYRHRPCHLPEYRTRDEKHESLVGQDLNATRLNSPLQFYLPNRLISRGSFNLEEKQIENYLSIQRRHCVAQDVSEFVNCYFCHCTEYLTFEYRWNVEIFSIIEKERVKSCKSSVKARRVLSQALRVDSNQQAKKRRHARKKETKKGWWKSEGGRGKKRGLPPHEGCYRY